MKGRKPSEHAKEKMVFLSPSPLLTSTSFLPTTSPTLRKKCLCQISLCQEMNKQGELVPLHSKESQESKVMSLEFSSLA